jgi:hypothetical protein
MNIIEVYKRQYKNVFNGPVSEKAVDQILTKSNVLDLTYRNWLIETGGGPIGSDWYDSLVELEESQKKNLKESWSVKGFVIGWDGAGNPIVLNDIGEIITEDHNFGGIHKIADSFTELLVNNLKA